MNGKDEIFFLFASKVDVVYVIDVAVMPWVHPELVLWKNLSV